ncbi:MAG: transcription termination/antitermination NusG family protein [candidate division WOR-3 bacterium]
MMDSAEGKKWLIFQTYSGKEKKALSAAQKVIKEHGLEGVVEPILPTEFVSKPVKKGKGSKKETIRINVEKPIYRGYLFVGVDGGKEVIDKVVNLLTETRLMRALTKRDEKTGEIIYAFLSDREVNELKQRIEVEKQKREQKIPFIEGERVRILMGNFEGLVGTVEEIYPEKRKIKVSVNLLSRVTPLIIDFDGVEKAD